MKLASYKEAASTRTKKPRQPLRTFAEIAAELGLTQCQLGAYFARSGGTSPKAVFVNRRSRGGQVSWYLPSEVRAWWKSAYPDGVAGKPGI